MAENYFVEEGYLEPSGQTSALPLVLASAAPPSSTAGRAGILAPGLGGFLPPLE